MFQFIFLYCSLKKKKVAQKTFYILEREADTISRLRTTFSESSDFLCIGVSDSYDEAMETILKYIPQLVFANADASFEGRSVFDLAQELHSYKKELPNFVAMSADKSKSYDAIKNSFFDFLLKPIEELDVQKTLLKLQKNQWFERPNLLCLKSYKDYRFINTDEILYLEADDNTTDIHMNDGRVVGGYHTLKYFEALVPSNFIRVHHSFIVNINYVARIHFGRSKCGLRMSEKEIPFSRSHRENVEYIKDILLKNSVASTN